MTESKDERESKKDAESAKASSSLEKVTDYHEETEVVDTGKATAALSQLAQRDAEERKKKLERERELAKVKVDEAHVKLIAAQFAVPVRYTRRKLRENGGDPVKTMLAFVNQKEPLPMLD